MEAGLLTTLITCDHDLKRDTFTFTFIFVLNVLTEQIGIYKVKVKQSHYMPSQALRVQGG
jgi:hypothetical protein